MYHNCYELSALFKLSTYIQIIHVPLIYKYIYIHLDFSPVASNAVVNIHCLGK